MIYPGDLIISQNRSITLGSYDSKFDDLIYDGSLMIRRADCYFVIAIMNKKTVESRACYLLCYNNVGWERERYLINEKAL